MKVSFFKDVKSVSPFKTVNVFKVLDYIKDGNYKEQILTVRQYIDDKKQRGEEKKKLPAITFAGKFETRHKDKLIQSSGLAILDFDDVDDIKAIRKEVNNDDFTMSSFLSPSGNGLKVLVKIPKVDNDKDYKSFYHEIIKHYQNYFDLDTSTKDISRLCFVSYDPDLYLNIDSEMFTDRLVTKPIEIKTNPKPVISIKDDNEIAKRVIVWFEKKWTSGINRNNNLFILSSAFNDFGVSKSIALEYCLQYQSSDFSETEINNLVNSAYKKTANFGTKAFEDSQKLNQIKRMAFVGADKEQIKKKLGEKNIDKVYNEVQKEIPKDIFWDVSEKGKIEISFFRFDRYLKRKGISKYFQDRKSPTFDFVIKDDNFINWIDTNRIKDIVKKDLISEGHIDVWDVMASNAKFFSRDYLSMLDTIDVVYKRDTKNESFLYYQNCAIRTTKDDIQVLRYEDIEDLVWGDQVIDRDIELKDKSEGVFKSFIWNISGKNKERYYTLKSVIGYLLHSFQDDANTKTIIFNDEMISDDVPNGGSGKGLFHKALGKLKNVCIENGKSFDPKGQFAFQKVNKDTQIFLMDDLPKNFNFEDLFSTVTEGMTVEKKGLTSFNIPLNESPKLSLTTNYTVKGEGPSFLRRVFEVEISNHYNDKHTPIDDFGHQFFTDWDATEWDKFDNFMIRCIQYFLKNGLVLSKKVNLELRKLRNNVGSEFMEFMESQDLSDFMVERKQFREQFNSIYRTVAKYNTPQKFNGKVKAYCDFYGIDLTEPKYNGLVNFHFRNGEKVINENDEDDFAF